MSSTPLNIALVGPAHPLRGGIANFNEALARQLAQENNRVELYSFSLQYPGFLFPGTTQFDNSAPPSDLTIHTLINSINPINWITSSIKIRKQNPDLIIVRFWLPFMGPCLGSILRLSIIGKKTKVIAITDNVIPHEKRPGDSIFTSWFVKACDGFIAMSKSVLNDLTTFTRTSHKKFLPHPIYNIFGEPVKRDEALLHLNLDPHFRYVLFFGFIRKYKGLDLLLKAFNQQLFNQPDVKLIIAGEFYEDPAEYHQLIKELKLEDRIIMRAEYIPSETVKHYFCASDIVAQTYHTATQSGVTQIAYHFNIPMLVTNVGGLSEIVPHHQVGYVTDTTPESIANHLTDFFENHRLATFAQNVIKEKERFNWSYFTNGLKELYVNL